MAEPSLSPTRGARVQAHPRRLYRYADELAVSSAILAATGLGLAAGTLLSSSHPGKAALLIALGAALAFALTHIVPGAGADGFREEIERAAQAHVELFAPQVETVLRTLRGLVAGALVATCLWLLDTTSPLVPAIALGAGLLAFERLLWVRGFETFRRRAVLRGTMPWTHARVFYAAPPTMLPEREPSRLAIGSRASSGLVGTAQRVGHFQAVLTWRARQLLVGLSERLRRRRARAGEQRLRRRRARAGAERHRQRLQPRQAAPLRVQAPSREAGPSPASGGGIVAVRPLDPGAGSTTSGAEGSKAVHPRHPRPGKDRQLHKDATVELEVLEAELDIEPSEGDATLRAEKHRGVEPDERKPDASSAAETPSRKPGPARPASPRRTARRDETDDRTARVKSTSRQPRRSSGTAAGAPATDRDKGDETPEPAQPEKQPTAS